MSTPVVDLDMTYDASIAGDSPPPRANGDMLAMDDITIVQSASSLSPSFAQHVTQQPRRHNIPRIFLYIITVAIYIVSEAVLRPGEDSRLFDHTTEYLDSHFKSPISSDPLWAKVTWPIVYIFQASWLLCVAYAIFRKTTTVQTKSDGSQIYIESYLYLYPDVFKTHVFYFFNAAQVLVVAYKFIYDKQILEAKILAQILIHLCLIAASIYACQGVKSFDYDRRNDSGAKLSPCLKGSRKSYELFMLRVFYLNGLTLYASWAFICTIVGLCSFMIHIEFLTVQRDIAAVLSMNIYLMHLAVYAIIDNFYLDSYTRYIISPYIIAMIATGASTGTDFHAKDAMKMQSAMILVFCVGFALLKLIRLLNRPIRKLFA